jgi:hypothetical protein
LRADFRQPLGQRRLGVTQLQRERDKTLLYAIVQIAFDLAAGVVGGGHDTGAGCAELRAAVGICDRGGDKLGELRHVVLGIG